MNRLYLFLSLASLLLPAQADELSAPVSTVRETPEAPALSLPEQRVRAGIVLLGELDQVLARVNDHDSAEASVAPVMRLLERLRYWAQSFTALPPLSEEERSLMEDRYLPVIRKLNERLRNQGERLAAAEYYGSHKLPAALVHLALLNQ
ncbi:MAG: hypothetical protein ACI4OS_00315 [Akkermansia sp.]